MIKMAFPSDNSITCVAKINQTFEVMLNPRASFFLTLHGSIIMVKISYRAISVELKSFSTVANPFFASRDRCRIRSC